MASVNHMLREIQSESLQKLLSSVQQKIKQPGSTAIPPFDSYLLSWRPKHGTRSPLRSGDVIHIQGHPGSGKTHFLYFLAATCVMPMKYLSFSIGGWNKAAFVMDMDGHFQISRFRDILINRLQLFLPALSVIPVVEHCLKHLHVFRPNSSSQLAVTLAHLPKYHANHFPGLELGMIAIHSIDASYWLDRFKAEQLRSTPSPKITASQNISLMLEGLRSSYGLITVLTDWGLPQRIIHLSQEQISTGHPPNLTAPDHSDPTASADVTADTRIFITAMPADHNPDAGHTKWVAQIFGNSNSCSLGCRIRGDGLVVD